MNTYWSKHTNHKGDTLQYTATHCNRHDTLQCTATHCNRRNGNALQCAASHCNRHKGKALQCAASHCNRRKGLTLQRAAAHCNRHKGNALKCAATLWERIRPVSYQSIFMLRTKVRNYLAGYFRVRVEPIWHTGLSRSTYRSHKILINGRHNQWTEHGSP